MIKEIENFKLGEFLSKEASLIEQYISVLQYAKPVETKRRVFNMKLKEVEDIKKTIFGVNDSEIMRVVGLVQGVDSKGVRALTIIEFFGLINSIKSQVEEIVSAESSSLSPKHTNIKWEAVNGSERMAKFGIYNTLEILSGGDILKYEAIMNLEYADVFTVLKMKRTQEDLRHEMEQIKIESK